MGQQAFDGAHAGGPAADDATAVTEIGSSAMPSSAKVVQARSRRPSARATQQSWQAPIRQKPARGPSPNSEIAQMTLGQQQRGQQGVALQGLDRPVADREPDRPAVRLGQAQELSAHGRRGSRSFGVLPVRRGSTIWRCSWRSGVKPAR